MYSVLKSLRKLFTKLIIRNINEILGNFSSSPTLSFFNKFMRKVRITNLNTCIIDYTRYTNEREVDKGVVWYAISIFAKMSSQTS